MKSNGFAPSKPEDLHHLINKAVAIRKHLERNGNDKDSKFCLILVGSDIHLLVRSTRSKKSYHQLGNKNYLQMLLLLKNISFVFF